MGKYLKLFKSHNGYTAYTADTENYLLPNVSYCEQEDECHFEGIKIVPMEERYLTFRATQSGTFKLSGNSVDYSLDSGKTWTTLASNTNSPTVAQGGTIMFKGNLTPNSTIGIGAFSSSAYFEAEGNPMSLLYGDDFKGKYSLEGYNYAFKKLFPRCNTLTSAENLSLPATTLADYCYNGMFSGCSRLTTAPVLSATTLANNCYYSMFYNCSGLTTAPQLPATTLVLSCYESMFAGCTSLTTAPELLATTLATRCYANMFQGCTSLTTAPELPATTLENLCYYYMFQGCTSLTTAPQLPATTLANQCYLSMFNYCTSLTTAPTLSATTMATSAYTYMFKYCTGLTTAPELPATTLANNCYYYMFSNCTSLTTAPSILPATTLANQCYRTMFYGCTSLTTAPELPATTLVDGCYNDMFNGCTSLNYIKALFTTTPSTTYTSNWVKNVAASGTFVKNSAATWNVSGVHGVPSGWAVQKVNS